MGNFISAITAMAVILCAILMMMGVAFMIERLSEAEQKRMYETPCSDMSGTEVRFIPARCLTYFQ